MKIKHGMENRMIQYIYNWKIFVMWISPHKWVKCGMWYEVFENAHLPGR